MLDIYSLICDLHMEKQQLHMQPRSEKKLLTVSLGLTMMKQY